MEVKQRPKEDKMFNSVKSYENLKTKEKDLVDQIEYIVWSGQSDRLEERLYNLEMELKAVRKELAAF